MPKKATCVQPKPEMSEEISVETTEKELWFSNIPEGGFKFTYKADSNQVSNLKIGLGKFKCKILTSKFSLKPILQIDFYEEEHLKILRNGIFR